MTCQRRRLTITLVLAFTPVICLAQRDSAACSTSQLETRFVPRTLLFSASAASGDSHLPHPLADELLLRVSDGFRMPGVVSPPVLVAAGSLPGDTSAGRDSSWALADISLVARVTFAKDGTNTNISFERSYDSQLDSVFEATVASALAHGGALPAPDRRTLRGDTVTFDIALGIRRVESDSVRQESDKAVSRGDRIEYAVGDIRLPHVHGFAMPVLKSGYGGPQYPRGVHSQAEGLVIAELVIDGDGQVIPQSVWVAESSAPVFSTAVLDYLLRVRPQFVPGRVGSCSRPVRLRQPFHFLAF